MERRSYAKRRIKVTKRYIPIKTESVADHYMAKIAQPEGMPSDTPKYLGPGSAPSSDEMAGQSPMILPSTVDRSMEIREIIKNYENLAKLVQSHARMWKKVLQSGGKETAGFLDNPQTWDDKKWGEAVRRTDKLLRDANEALMRIDEMTEEDMSEGQGYEVGGLGDNQAAEKVEGMY